MPVETKQIDGAAVIIVSGRLILGGETEMLEAAVERLIAGSQKTIVLDIAALDYMDSAGVGMLVACLTTTKKAGGTLKVAGANPRIRRILSMTGVDSLMSLYDSVA